MMSNDDQLCSELVQRLLVIEQQLVDVEIRITNALAESHRTNAELRSRIIASLAAINDLTYYLDNYRMTDAKART